MAITIRTTVRQGLSARPGWLRACVAGLVVAALLALPGRAQAESPQEFQDALSIAGAYHRALSYLSGRFPDQPETAYYEHQRLTAAALLAQRAVDIQPCFAKWWAHEYMGLKLTAISHELRASYSEVDPEADLIERLGIQMWMEAEQLLPVAGSACGVAPRPDGITIVSPSTSQ